MCRSNFMDPRRSSSSSSCSLSSFSTFNLLSHSPCPPPTSSSMSFVVILCLPILFYLFYFIFSLQKTLSSILCPRFLLASWSKIDFHPLSSPSSALFKHRATQPRRNNPAETEQSAKKKILQLLSAITPSIFFLLCFPFY